MSNVTVIWFLLDWISFEIRTRWSIFVQSVICLDINYFRKERPLFMLWHFVSGSATLTVISTSIPLAVVQRRLLRRNLALLRLSTPTVAPSILSPPKRPPQPSTTAASTPSNFAFQKTEIKSASIKLHLQPRLNSLNVTNRNQEQQELKKKKKKVSLKELTLQNQQCLGELLVKD